MVPPRHSSRLTVHLASPEVLLGFVPAVWLAWWTAARWGPRWSPAAVLLVGSAGFYAWERPDHLPVLVGSILVNHALMRRLHAGGGRGWLWGGVALNLLLLGVFKYTGFVVGELSALLDQGWTRPRFVLPLGLSFFTFQQVGALVASARGRQGRVSLLHHALHTAFFPQLVAGPIVRSTDFHPQLDRGWLERLTVRRVGSGLALVCLGLFKKTVVADSLAPIVDRVFRAPAVGAGEAWTGALGYTLQLFYDFGGYADLAMGLGLLFGLALPANFDAPYRATSLRDFWRRWHITLGDFLREHVYIALGGRREGPGREWAALLVTFALGGLWHGAGWTFVWWGLLHGLVMVVDAWGRRRGWVVPRPVGWVGTMLVVVFGWVLFRSVSLDQALHTWGAMVGQNGVGDGMITVVGLVGLLGLTVALPVSWRWATTTMWATPRQSALVCAAAGLVGLVHSVRTLDFLYFRF